MSDIKEIAGSWRVAISRPCNPTKRGNYTVSVSVHLSFK